MAQEHSNKLYFQHMALEFIERGNLKGLKKCYEISKIDPRANDDEALQYAATCGKPEILDYLVQTYNINMSSKNAALVDLARKNYNFDIISHLVQKHGATVNTPDRGTLKDAIDAYDLRTVRDLVENCGADLGSNPEQIITLASTSFDPDICPFLVKHFNITDPRILKIAFIAAIKEGNIDALKYYIEDLELDFHVESDEAIKVALHEGGLGVFTYLVEQGALEHALAQACPSIFARNSIYSYIKDLKRLKNKKHAVALQDSIAKSALLNDDDKFCASILTHQFVSYMNNLAHTRDERPLENNIKRIDIKPYSNQLLLSLTGQINVLFDPDHWTNKTPDQLSDVFNALTPTNKRRLKPLYKSAKARLILNQMAPQNKPSIKRRKNTKKL